MMRKIICLIVCGIFIISFSSSLAGDGKEHEKDLEMILLGRTLIESEKDPQKSSNSAAIKFGYIEDAIYLCIDQMGSGGQKWLDELNQGFGVNGIPTLISEISVPTHEHERYTHLGWDYKDYPKKEKWALRQNILLSTVSKVFGFPEDKNKTGNDRYSMECVEMSKLIYYIHILGDHARNKFESTTERIQLRNASKTKGEIEAGLINELRLCISKLFWNQRSSMMYNWLMVKLNTVRFRAWRNGEEVNEKKHETVKDIASDTIRYLHPQIKKMLIKTDFFRKEFAGIINE